MFFLFIKKWGSRDITFMDMFPDVEKNSRILYIFALYFMNLAYACTAIYSVESSTLLVWVMNE